MTRTKTKPRLVRTELRLPAALHERVVNLAASRQPTRSMNDELLAAIYAHLEKEKLPIPGSTIEASIGMRSPQPPVKPSP